MRLFVLILLFGIPVCDALAANATDNNIYSTEPTKHNANSDSEARHDSCPWRGRHNERRRFAFSVETPHRISRFEEYLRNDAFLALAAGANAIFNFTPDVDGEYAYPDMHYRLADSPGLTFWRGACDCNFPEATAIPTQLSVEAALVICGTALTRTVRSISRRSLRWVKYGFASAMRRSVTFLEKLAPPLAHAIRQWGWIWQPTYSPRWLKDFYDNTVDPYHFDGTPYEQEKYAHTMDLLNGRIYRTALEVGAAEGIFTQMLAPICTKLLAIDVAEAAVARGKQRVADCSNVTFLQAALPHQLPDGPFDLIVASDVLYYFPKDVVLDISASFVGRMNPGGILFILHYLGNFRQATMGREVHDLVKLHPALEQIHDETVAGKGPRGEGYAITIFRKLAA